MPRLSVVFLTLYPVETASTRQRIHKNVRLFPPDVEAVILPGITAAAERRLARLGGGPLARGLFLAEEVGRKLWHLWRARRFDVVVVQKGLTVMNLRGLPRLLLGLGRPLVFDFDDAVHLGPPQSFRSPWLAWMSEPEQIRRLLPRFAAVVAGNRHLAAVAEAAGARARVIPTPMDTDWYRLRPIRPGGDPVIGWSGSSSTNHYVNRLGPVLRRLAERWPQAEFRVISNDDRGIDWPALRPMRTRFVPWRLETLVEDLLGFDIGLMPLEDDEWSRSKCGGKILQYMACGIPPVASPVGINQEIISDGRDGFLAGDDDQWVERIGRLLGDPELRRRMGVAARERIERDFSNRVCAPRLAALLSEVAGR